MIYKKGFVTLLFTMVFSGLLALGFLLLKAVGSYQQATQHTLKELEILVCCQEFVEQAASHYLLHKKEIDQIVRDAHRYQYDISSCSMRDVQAQPVFDSTMITITVLKKNQPVKQVFIAYAPTDTGVTLSNAYIE